MWTPGGKQAEENKDTCGYAVEPEQPAMECDICQRWEHVECLRRPDKIDERLYAALMASPSKALLFYCTTCRRKGCIVKQLYKMQSDLAVAHEQRLASARAVDEARDLIAVLKEDKARLQTEVDEMRGVLLNKVSSEYKAEPINNELGKLNLTKTETSEKEVDSVNATSEPRRLSTMKSEKDWDAESGEDEDPMQATTANFKHPKGFKELRFRVDKFTGDPKEVDFDVWLEDFLEATGDCGWNDTERAKWFSWFLSSPAKSTWQRTLKSTHKGSWEEIVRVYRGQYGVHMDPRTAYQRCH